MAEYPIIFHYSFKRYFTFFAASIVFLLISLFMLANYYAENPIVIVTCTVICFLYFASLLIFMLSGRKLATITKEGIQIDRNQMLKWNDIDYIQEGNFPMCTLGRKKLIYFYVKNIGDYKLNCMQKMNKRSGFTEFNIPLYAMDKADAVAIKAELVKNTKIK